jgi:hypothetical protein
MFHTAVLENKSDVASAVEEKELQRREGEKG